MTDADIHVENNALDEVLDELAGQTEEPVPVPVENKYGVSETKDALTFIISFAHAAFEYTNKGLLIVANALFTLLPEAITAVKGADQIPNELGDLTDDERAGLLYFFKEKFDITDYKHETINENGLTIVNDIADLTGDIREYSKPTPEIPGM